MAFTFELEHLLSYSDWERSQWHVWFREQGPAALAVDLGPNGDGRNKNIGELVRHIFSAETRYVERVKGTPLTDTGVIPPDDGVVLADPMFGTEDHGHRREIRSANRSP